MNKPEYFEILDTYAVFRPMGEVSLEHAVQLMTSAIAYAREQQVRKLLAVATGLTGFKSPSITERYYASQRFAQAAESKMSIAMVLRKEMIDRRRFGVLVAENIGLNFNRFASEEEALVWLLRNG